MGKNAAYHQIQTPEDSSQGFFVGPTRATVFTWQILDESREEAILEYLFELGLFLGKSLIVLFVIGGIFVLIAFLVAKAQQRQELEVQALNERLEEVGHFLKSFRMNKAESKAAEKKRKEEEKKLEQDPTPRKQLFVIEFKGDVKASAVDSLREEVNAVLQAAEPADEVLISIDSPGGVVHTYGLASAQLLRLRTAGLQVTIAVDEVAASGGYLMACVAHKIIASPFAIVGSIGVIAQVPNFHRLLKKYDVDYKEYTSGEFKRTVSLFGEISTKGEEKFVAQLEDTHALFKDYVLRYRPQIKIAEVATGEYWFGERALGLNLVDAIQTSDDFILQKVKEKFLVLKVKHEEPKTLQDRLAGVLGAALESSIVRILGRIEKQRYF